MNRNRIRAHAAIILSLFMMLSLLGSGILYTGAGMERAYSYAAQSAGGFEYAVSGGTVTLTAYTGRDAAPVIPVSIDGKKVTAIGPECFRGNANIKKIRIPEGITEIGDYAFEACSAATELSLPSTLKKISKGAFSGDAQLTALEIPAGAGEVEMVVLELLERIDRGFLQHAFQVGGMRTFRNEHAMSRSHLVVEP